MLMSMTHNQKKDCESGSFWLQPQTNLETPVAHQKRCFIQMEKIPARNVPKKTKDFSF